MKLFFATLLASLQFVTAVNGSDRAHRNDELIGFLNGLKDTNQQQQTVPLKIFNMMVDNLVAPSKCGESRPIADSTGRPLYEIGIRKNRTSTTFVYNYEQMSYTLDTGCGTCLPGSDAILKLENLYGLTEYLSLPTSVYITAFSSGTYHVGAITTKIPEMGKLFDWNKSWELYLCINTMPTAEPNAPA